MAGTPEGEERFPKTMKLEEKIELLEKAYSLLILGLGDKVLREVKKEKSIANVWGKLNSLYLSKEVLNRIILK